MLTPQTNPGVRDQYEETRDALLRIQGSGLRIIEASLARRELGIDDIEEMLQDLSILKEEYRLTRG